MKFRETLLASGGALVGLGLPDIADATIPVQEKAAPPFAVNDAAGKQHRLDEFKGKIVVLEWTSCSCPFVRAQHTSGKMQELQG